MTDDSARADALSAYVDGELDRQRTREIEAWIESDPEASAAVRAYRDQRALLHAAFDTVLSEPLPARLTRRYRLARPVLRVAARSEERRVGKEGRARWRAEHV